MNYLKHYLGGKNKKRVISVIALICVFSLMLNIGINNRLEEADLSRSADENTELSPTAGVVSATAINIDSLDTASVADSDIVTTAASIGALYGYQNIGICVVEEGNLNIRESASKEGKLIGKFPKNAACEVVSEEGDWLYIKSGDISGYVMAQYIVTGDGAWTMASQLAELVATSKTGGLRVRTETNTDCQILAQLGDGEEVTVIEDLGDWIKVEVDGEQGYVSSEYVDVELSLKTAMTLAQARYGADVSDVRVDLCDYALQFVGYPYVWGGTSLTKGADCSGFVLSIYKKYGFSLPHSSRAQANYGTKISTSQLQPGDLIFYGSGKSISHVAIYIGGGQIVHASNKRDGIKISNAFYRTPIKCVRLITD